MELGPQRKLLRNEFIETMFGSPHRLDIYAEIGKLSIDPPEEFSEKKIADTLSESLELSPWAVPKEMHYLQRMGMIETIDGLPSRRVHSTASAYRRTDSPAWKIVEAAIEAVDSLYPEEPEEKD